MIKKVLVVEHDPDMLGLIREELIALGFEVHTADSETESERILRCFRPEQILIILDDQLVPDLPTYAVKYAEDLLKRGHRVGIFRAQNWYVPIRIPCEDKFSGDLDMRDRLESLLRQFDRPRPPIRRVH